MFISQPRIVLAAADVACSLGRGVDRVWKALLEGRSGIVQTPEGWPTAQLGDLPRNDWPSRIDLVEEVIDRVLEEAKLPASTLRDPETILLVATTKGDISGLLSEGNRGGTSLGPLLGQLQRRMGSTGYGELASCACASGGVATARAVRLLQLGVGRRALVVGLDFLDPFLVHGFSSLGALSASPCRPYHRQRDGLSLGEGVAAALLVAEEVDGQRESETGVSVGISGVGTGSDAHSIAAPCPNGTGLRIAIEKALLMANGCKAPMVVGAVCGHGTGTKAYDSMETAALAAAFDGSPPPLYGLKGAIGHTLGCSMLLSMAISKKALEEGLIPGTVGCHEPEVDAGVITAPKPLGEAKSILVAGSGFGGVGAAVLLDLLGYDQS